MTLSSIDPFAVPVMLRRDLITCGYTDRAIARLVRAGQWVRIRQGAYTEASLWAMLDERERHVLLTRAVVAQACTSVVVSHGSGLVLHGAPTWGIDLADVHITRRDGRTGRKEAGVNQHRGCLVDSDVTSIDGIDVMRPTRLALEITTVASVEAALAVVNDLLHRGCTTLPELAARYGDMRAWPSTLSTDVVLRLADPAIESVGESRTYYLCFRHGLPMPVCQYEVRDESGRLIGRVDFAWPELGVFLEFDGRVKYEKLLRPGQRASDVVLAEKRREEEICRTTGWRCVRISWADLAHPERTAALIRSTLYPRTARR